MDSSNISLRGNNQQKVIQLLSLVQDRQLSPEQLDKLIPHTKEFFEEVFSQIKRQTEIDKSYYDKFIDSSLQIINHLVISMKEAPTQAERIEILTAIVKIHERMTEVKKHEKDRDNKTKTIWQIIGGIIMGLLFILTAGVIAHESKSSDKT